MDTKRKIIKLTDEGYSYREIERKKNIPLSCISKWIAGRHNIENPLFKSSIKKLPGGGKKAFTSDYEPYLCKYINDLSKLNLPVTTSVIVLEAISIVPDFQLKSYNSYHLWVYDFLKRHRYTIRKETLFQQKLPINALEKIFNFIKECFTTRIYYKIDKNLNLLGNMDETPCWMEMKINKTIAKIG